MSEAGIVVNGRLSLLLMHDLLPDLKSGKIGAQIDGVPDNP
jgi:hypothetical protein